MSAMTHKGYAAQIEFDPEDHIFVGRLAGISDIVTFHGASVVELEAEFRVAVDHYLAVSEKMGIAPQRPYSGEIELRISPEIHARAAVAAETHGKTLNQWVAEVLAAAS